MSHQVLSFKYALEGIAAAFKEEPNLKFHFAAAILVLTAGFYYQITQTEWLVLILTIGLILTLELTNAAIEAVVDSFTDQAHPRAKLAKDVAAGAVLIGAITATALGLIIFLPYLI